MSKHNKKAKIKIFHNFNSHKNDKEINEHVNKTLENASKTIENAGKTIQSAGETVQKVAEKFGENTVKFSGEKVIYVDTKDDSEISVNGKKINDKHSEIISGNAHVVINKDGKIKKENEHLKNELNRLKNDLHNLKGEIKNKHEKISNLELQIRLLNESYKQEVLKKANEAQALLDQKIKEYQSKYEKDLMIAKKYAFKDKATDLIRIISDFSNALDFQTDDQKMLNFLNGFKMFNKMFQNYLANHHIKEINVKPGDHFNPNTMEAVESIATDLYQTNQVIKVVKKGYTLHDLVIMPTLVEVAK